MLHEGESSASLKRSTVLRTMSYSGAAATSAQRTTTCTRTNTRHSRVYRFVPVGLQSLQCRGGKKKTGKTRETCGAVTPSSVVLHKVASDRPLVHFQAPTECPCNTVQHKRHTSMVHSIKKADTCDDKRAFLLYFTPHVNHIISMIMIFLCVCVRPFYFAAVNF